jgi:hypothetical protein
VDAEHAASSPDYSRRLEVGRRLAAIAELGPVTDDLMRLLLDPEDTAVSLENRQSASLPRRQLGTRTRVRGGSAG